MEITMTDKSALVWVHEVLLGFRPKNAKGKRKDGTPYLKQYLNGDVHLEMHQVCLLIWPFGMLELDKIQQIIEYYSDKKVMNGNVVSLQEYKQLMALE